MSGADGRSSSANAGLGPSRSGPAGLAVIATDRSGAGWDDMDAHIFRIRRLGKKLFDVANCVVTFGNTVPAVQQASGDAVEASFCYDAALFDALAGVAVVRAGVVLDTYAHPSLRRHGAVTGAPGIRFYASYPVLDECGGRVGCVNLIDYTPRAEFGSEERQMLADLAALVERELHLRLMSASQLVLQKKNKNLRRKSLIDPLIGTWNRGAIMRILSIEAVRCDNAAKPLSLIVADLDYFKKINDCHGHPAGDAMLVKVASRLRSCIRSQEALGRYGGEEFLIVLPGSSHDTALAVAERMRIAVASQPEMVGGTTLQLTISAGVASTDMFPTATTEELISRADIALYAAKDAGRNCVVNATPDLS